MYNNVDKPGKIKVSELYTEEQMTYDFSVEYNLRDKSAVITLPNVSECLQKQRVGWYLTEVLGKGQTGKGEMLI